MAHGFGVPLLVLVASLSVAADGRLSTSLAAALPQTVAAGYAVAAVDLNGRGSQPWLLTTDDPDFAVGTDGTIVTTGLFSVPAGGRTFSVWIQDGNGDRSKVEVTISQKPVEGPKTGVLKRYKRRWSPLPFNIVENDSPPFPKDVEQISSDSSASHSVYYIISGPGVDEYPSGVFSVDSDTGRLKVLRPVDREEFPQFIFQARVFDRRTKVETDEPLPITVDVDDVNDNAPTFVGPMTFHVLEQNKGVVAGQLNATDRDQPGTPHTQIRFNLLDGKDLFIVNPQTGVISTVTPTLDREVKDTHLVTVEARDMNGAANGLFSTATATILLKDINDNPPVFTKPSHSVSVLENVAGKKLLLRIPVEDKDLKNTPNWKTKFLINKGNEDGYFQVETDPQTNEGLLYLMKPLDYEKTKAVNLQVQAQNEVPLSGTQATWASIPVQVNVQDVDEGPEFIPATLHLRVKENTANGTVIGTYTARDPETNSSVGIKYYELSDPASWIEVEETTGKLKVVNTIDRESDFVKNLTLYNVTVKAVDATSKTGTGTVLISVEDENDNVPMIPKSDLTMCEKEGELTSVQLTAVDRDLPPFSSPFFFQLDNPSEGKWTLKRFNDTTANLSQAVELPSGLYSVPVLVKDLQGQGQTQTAKVRICRCLKGQCVASRSSSALGVGGILALLLGLALLLLLCILAVLCVTKREKLELEDSAGSGGMLLTSNTEGPGEEGANLTMIPTSGEFSNLNAAVDGGLRGTVKQSTWTASQQALRQQSMDVLSTDMQDVASVGQYGFEGFGASNTMSYKYKDMKTLHTWQTNGRFLQMKLGNLAREQEGTCADDIIHSYRYEGEGSLAGSVGCCSDQDLQDNLDFLNTLGPKFRTLAEVCTKK
ncbi:desmocollin-2-like [Denticeps clupeoides]|uniref:Cadherin domain-containing protein n=1 Tax=Denticeps clupeoides TaxID=299321 RepID=A0AAY4CWT8_9TELE|nr:desmocollin-2-like [Denticeps clupeoides]